MELSDWFKGFEKGIARLLPEQRAAFFSECGKNCVNGGTLSIYRKLYEEAKGDMDAFFQLANGLPGVKGEVVEKGKVYYLTFLKSGIPRQDIFLVTKVWISNAGEEKAAASIDESLRKLRTDYIDLLLIHQAYGDVFGSWRAMEKAYRTGKVRAIGVSNFQAGRFFDFAHYVDIKPMVNQLQCNPLVQQQGIGTVLAEHGTKMMAWGPLGGEGAEGVVKNELLASIGKGYGKTAAQVALRWLTQRGIVAIPKSTHVERMRQNLDIFDFTLTDEEMKRIATLNSHDAGTVSFGDPQFVKFLIETYG